MSAPPTDPPGLVYAASFPKSGNTWFRAVHAAAATGAPPDINRLHGSHAGLRREVDHVLGFPSADLTLAELLTVRRAVEEHAAAEGRPGLRKAHDAYRPAAGLPPVVAGPPARAVYLVRDPRDVVVSFAHHIGAPLPLAAERLRQADALLEPPELGLTSQVPQVVGSWSQHVVSWLDQDEIPVHVVRYEDARADPAATFAPALRFSGLDVTGPAVAVAVERASFARLREQEDDAGFRERMPRTDGAFFRRGQAGAWREELPPALARQIVADHGDVMARLGYDS